MMPNIAELLVQITRESERRQMKIEQLEAEIKRLTEELKNKSEKG